MNTLNITDFRSIIRILSHERLHKDKRKNIPTEELRDFVAEDENAPKTMLYPRDPSLDPQLVWKGKDAKVATARTLWVSAVNNHGGFGRWGFLEVDDPWDAENAIRAFLEGDISNG